MYMFIWMVEMGFVEENYFVNFVYVKVLFDEIDNVDVFFSDEDYSVFLKENESRYEVDEEIWVFDYVVFNVVVIVVDSVKF